jgi:hypothetical protein
VIDLLTKRFKILAVIVVVAIVVGMYGYTAASSAGLFKTPPNPNILYYNGTKIPYCEVGAAGGLPSSLDVGPVWFGPPPINSTHVVHVTGKWSSTASLRLLIIPTSQVKNHTYRYSILLNSTIATSGVVNITLAPIELGYQLIFVPAANSSGTITITQEFLMSNPN